jgi:hypothetical protein
MPYPTSTGAARLADLSPVFAAQRGELEYRAEVAPGVVVTWDPADPHHYVDFVITDERNSAAVVERVPWLRLAAVMLLDRRLYLPLDRSLLDAELAAAQFAAARTLKSAGQIREFLIGKALAGARRASSDVVAYLERFVVEGRRPPSAFAASLGTLARCYAALSGEVREYDSALNAVTEVGHRLSALHDIASRGRRVVHPPSTVEPPRPGAGQVDPRSVPARVVRLGPTTATAEITLTSGSGSGLRVRVPAFADEPFGRAADLGVRVIDRGSGRVRGYGVLGQRPQRDRASEERHFEGLVELPEVIAPEDVRIDLYDIGMAAPPVSVDDTELRRVRRATLFLSNWRALVADVRLWGVSAAPTDRLQTIVRQLTDDHSGSDDEPLWSGGPSRSNLCSLVALGDRALTGLLRAKRVAIPDDDGGAAAVVKAVSGPGELLVAEVAAAYERAQPPNR